MSGGEAATADQLLSRLGRQGVHLWTERGRLRARAPEGVLTAEIRADLEAHREALLVLLTAAAAPAAEELPIAAVAEELPPIAPAVEDLPAIAPAPEARHQPFPLTEIQQAYLVGQSGAFALGRVACHAYFELDGVPLDLARLAGAWNALVARHDMLRAVALPDGRQQVLAEVADYAIAETDLRGLAPAAAAVRLDELRAELSRRARRPEAWPLFEIHATWTEERRMRLHFGIDLLIVDAASLMALFAEWAELYRDPEAPAEPLGLAFRDYVLAELAGRAAPAYAAAERWWLPRLADLPPAPELPLARGLDEVAQPRFARHAARLPREDWARFRALAQAAALTPSAALCAAFVEVLAAWGKTPRFTLVLPMFQRHAAHPDLDRVLGDFTSTLLLAAESAAPGEPFAARAARLLASLGEALAHSRVSGVNLLRERQRRTSDGGAVLLPVVFTSLLGHRAFQDGGGPPWSWLGDLAWGISQTPQVWLDHHVYEDRGALTFNWDVVEELFPPGLIEDMFAAYRELLARLAADAAAWQEAPRLTPAAHRALYAQVNATQAPVPVGLLHEPWLRQARSHPERPAVISAAGTLSHGELLRLAADLAHELRRLGAGRNRLVAVVMEKGWEQVAAVFGILGAGAAYLPIAADLPAERIAALLADGLVELAVTQEHLAATLAWPPGVRPLTVGRPEGGAAPAAAWPEPVDGGAGPGDLAYVIYTSGSTGRPKGVVIDHRGALNTVLDINHRFAVTAGDRVLGLSSLSFDLSVWDLFGVLGAGGAVVVPEPWSGRDPGRWAAWLASAGVTLWNTVPTLMEMLVEHLEGRGETLAESLRLVLLSGDWIPPTLPRRIAALRPDIATVSLGGATEASIWSIAHPIVPGDEGARSIPYGRALANQSCWVLDAALAPRPLWVTGQIHIGGIGLAQGYWRDAAKTRASFVADPASGERLYRTGDLGRWLPNGEIEILGRDDSQVKVGGHRIELGEVEAALLRHDGVRAAVAVAAGDPRGHRRLVAYVVPARPQAPPSAEELRGFLAATLPEAMVPSQVVTLAALPLTANGKVDRSALPALDPEAALADAAPPTPPRTPREQQLAALWCELLGREQVSVHDDFLHLGGNSLLAIRLHNELRRRFGVDLPLRTLLRARTVALLAAEIEPLAGPAAAARPAAEEALPTIVPAPAAELLPFPLTDVQEAYWLGRGSGFELGNVAPHAYLELDCPGLELARFERSWQRLIDRHAMLRAVVLPDGRQQVLADLPAYRIAALDLRAVDAAEAARELAAVRERLSHQVLAADRWPLFEIGASLLPGGTVRLHFSLDLLVGDAWSMLLLIRELADLYERPEAELPPLELSFRDYVLACQELERSPRHERSLAFWRARLDDLAPAPGLPLLCDPAQIARPRFVRHTAALPPETWQRLREGAAGAGLTPSLLLCAAFAEVLAAWSVTPRFTINTTLFNRLPLHPQVDRVVGDFTSVILLEVDAAPAGGFRARALRLQERLWEDLDHRLVSGVRVLRELARRRGRAPRAMMPVVFTSTLIEGGQAGAAGRSGLEWFRLGEPVYSVSQTPQVWLDHQVFEDRGALTFNWDVVEELFPPGLIEDMFAAYGELLARLAADAAAWQEAPRLTPAAHRALYTQVNATQVPVPVGLLHEPWLRQARSHPERPAVISAAGTLSHGELLRLAADLAHELRRLGAGRNRLVAVVMEKGWEQVAAVFGILGAGAAYLPIAADLPAERIAALLADGLVELAVTQEHLAATLAWPPGVRPLTVGRPEGGAAAAAAAWPEPVDGGAGPGDLAYVIYTSGSTGRPKGVVIDHRGALNTVLDINHRFAVTAGDRVLGLSSLSFDLSVWDLFGVLGAGGAVVVPEPWSGRDPGRWAAWLASAGVTLWNTVPTLMEMLVEHLEGRGETLAESLRLVLLSGDWIPPTLPRRIAALRPDIATVSLGGATEASIWSIAHPIVPGDEGARSIPYGRALANQSCWVLDAALAPRPLWVTGQIHIGGIGLAQGYWRDAAKTRASFVADPASGERLYRTGDLGRWLPNGEIEILGRDDSQVKVGGHRIELGEVEAALLRHDGVRAAVAVAAGDPRGHRRLVAYVVPARREAAPPSAAPAAAGLGEAFGELGEVLTDPLARLEHKLRHLATRRLDAGPLAVQFDRPAPTAELAAAHLSRRSHRVFLDAPLPLARLGELLACLSPLEIDGQPRYRHASAGGIYPVQTYLYVAPGRVLGLAGGTWYYEPAEHLLLPLAPDARLDAGVHAAINRAAFAASAFSLFLVGELAAIQPLYGALARDFCLLEAGYMSQLLMSAAGELAIGLCPIGGLDFAPLRQLLDLGDTHIPLHSLVGGAIDPAQVAALPRPASGGGEPAAGWLAALRAALSRQLPESMIPAAFVVLDELPLTANGKVDRARLPLPEQPDAAAAAVPTAPRSDLERRLAAAFCDLIGVERIGVLDNFFSLGASSVHLVRLASRLRDIVGREVPVVELFRCATIAELAALLDDQPGGGAAERGEQRAEVRRAGRARRRQGAGGAVSPGGRDE